MKVTHKYAHERMSSRGVLLRETGKVGGGLVTSSNDLALV